MEFAIRSQKKNWNTNLPMQKDKGLFSQDYENCISQFHHFWEGH